MFPALNTAAVVSTVTVTLLAGSAAAMGAIGLTDCGHPAQKGPTGRPVPAGELGHTAVGHPAPVLVVTRAAAMILLRCYLILCEVPLVVKVSQISHG
jgi:hypothetical protein